MFGRKKEPAAPPVKKKSGGAALMAQLGMGLDMDMDGAVYGDLDNDADLEAELRALQDDDDDEPGTRANRKGKAPKGNMKSIMDLDKMIADCTRDLSDEDVSDTEDPDLMAELEGLDSDEDEPEDKHFKVSSSSSSKPVSVAPKAAGGSSLTVLQERLDMYQQAHASAKASSDSSKARRLERGLQTLEALLKQAKAGKPISEDDIPPTVAVSVSKQPPAAVQPTPSVTQPLVPTRPAPQPQSTQVVPARLPSAVSAEQYPAAPVAKPRAVIQPVQIGQVAPGAPPVNVAKAALSAPAVSLQTGPASTSVVSTAQRGQKELLIARRDQYKMAAVKAKQSGNTETAMEYMRTYKQFVNAVQSLEQGMPVDMSTLPSSPPAEPVAMAKPTSQVIAMQREVHQGTEEEPAPELTQEDKLKLFKAPEKAGTVMEALQQRLSKYKEGEDAAKQEGNSSKIKRMARIVKQYEDAIKQHKAGKPVDYDELPCPPGYPPFPVESAGKPNVVKNSDATQSPTPTPKSAMAVPSSEATKVSPKPSLQKQASVVHSRAEQQTVFLLERQTQFKQAAMSAKTSGDIELAKKYLRLAKGFDQMIEASRAGLPVDLSQIPAPPGAGSEEGFEFVNSSDIPASDTSSGDRESVYKRLQAELVKQIKMCESNRDHFTKLGDVSSATKFDKSCQSTRKDLEALKNAYDHDDPVPRFHYETRQFSLVQCCTDLGDNDLELIIIRGLNFNLPAGFSASDMNTFVKYEFPFPTETPQLGETGVVKSSSSPEYNQSYKLDVNRKSRGLLRVLKSTKCCKLEVWYKRGFLKGDKLLGTVSIKLQPLEDKCVYHDCYDLMDGRKAVGGKLEVKIRIRDPYVNRQVEEVKEKWLVIDQFERRPAPLPPKVTDSKVINVKPASETRPMQASLSVLRYERQLLDQQIEKYKSKLKPDELKSLQAKGQNIDKQVADLGEQLKKGGAVAHRAYADSISRLQVVYLEEAKALAKQNGSQDKIQMILTKKKLVDKEIETIRQRFPAT